MGSPRIHLARYAASAERRKKDAQSRSHLDGGHNQTIIFNIVPARNQLNFSCCTASPSKLMSPPRSSRQTGRPDDNTHPVFCLGVYLATSSIETFMKLTKKDFNDNVASVFNEHFEITQLGLPTWAMIHSCRVRPLPKAFPNS